MHGEFIQEEAEAKQKEIDSTTVKLIKLAKAIEALDKVIESSERKSKMLCIYMQQAKDKATLCLKSISEVVRIIEEMEKEKKDEFALYLSSLMSADGEIDPAKGSARPELPEAFDAWAIALHLKIRALDLLANAESMEREVNDLQTKLGPMEGAESKAELDDQEVEAVEEVMAGPDTSRTGWCRIL